MKPISADPISQTTVHLSCDSLSMSKRLATASGFIYKSNEKHYLITNWHVVTGRHPDTGICIDPTLIVPDTLSTLFRKAVRLDTGVEGLQGFAEKLPLYDGNADPNWYEHPVHGRVVDVVALPIPDEIQSVYKLAPINEVPFDTGYNPWVADDLFVIGYPFDKTPFGFLPLWKRASVATEPDVDVDQLPKMLIDTGTRSGLSGSPVIMQRIGIHGMVGDAVRGAEIIGRIRNFVGVYSGRVDNDLSKAQIGIVWKARVLDEILSARVRGKNPAYA